MGIASSACEKTVLALSVSGTLDAFVFQAH